MKHALSTLALLASLAASASAETGWPRSQTVPGLATASASAETEWPRSQTVPGLATASAATETWELRMIAKVPRVADNTQSLGYRRYQVQKLVGCFTVETDPSGWWEPTITFCSLRNLTHTVNGQCVTYGCSIDPDYVRWHGIGSNATGDFDTRSVSFNIVAEPNYAIGEEPTDDNSFVLTFAGSGDATRLQGYAAGTQGCGCKEYGHTSPTRIWSTTTVVDTAATYARWRARRVK